MEKTNLTSLNYPDMLNIQMAITTAAHDNADRHHPDQNEPAHDLEIGYHHHDHTHHISGTLLEDGP